MGSTRGSLPPSIRVPSAVRRRLLLAGLLGMLVLLAVLDRLTARPGPRADYQRYHGGRFLVARVIDGDTLDIAVPDSALPTTRLRLWGVDAPELDDPDPSAARHAQAAARFARHHLEGRPALITLSPDRPRDRYGRLLAYVATDPGAESFNERLIREGFARADARSAHLHERRFEAAERRARREGLGLWAPMDNQPPELVEAASHEAGQDDPE
jgi:endonuclease YncB( thermonuclease family)